MADKQVKIVQKSPGRLEPEMGFAFQVDHNDVITFTTDDSIIKGLTITFAGESPFGSGQLSVPYKRRLPVAVTFDGAATSKKFLFRCNAEVNGQPISGGGDAGGEMEVIRSG